MSIAQPRPSELPLGFYELGTPTGLLALNTDGTPTGLAPGSDYKICWAHNPTAVGDYKVQIDPDAELVGPVAGDLLSCVLGLVCDVTWVANKGFEISEFEFKFWRARTCELVRARSRLYRSQLLQVNTRWKALAEIYTMHSFAPFSNLNVSVKNC